MKISVVALILVLLIAAVPAASADGGVGRRPILGAPAAVLAVDEGGYALWYGYYSGPPRWAQIEISVPARMSGQSTPVTGHQHLVVPWYPFSPPFHPRAGDIFQARIMCLVPTSNGGWVIENSPWVEGVVGAPGAPTQTTLMCPH